MIRYLENPVFVTSATIALMSAALWAAMTISMAPMANSHGASMNGDIMMLIMASKEWSWRIMSGTALMWLFMMLAMMLPSMLPMVATYSSIAAKEHTGSLLAGRIFLFGLGYFMLWAVFSVGAALLQLSLRESTWFIANGTKATPVAAGVLFLIAGLYQLTPVKETCLRHCRSPMAFLLAHWKPGIKGAFPVGLHHGAFCVGCCGVFMLLMFVFGTMTVWWMALLALYFLAEKLLPRQEQWGRAVGVLLIIIGVSGLGFAAI